MTQWTGLSSMARIEIVVGGADVAAVGGVLTDCGATGYTMLSGVSGLGHHGFHQGHLHFNDRDSLRLLIAVVPEERAGPVITAIRKLLEDRPGVLFVSETYVSRPEYFT